MIELEVLGFGLGFRVLGCGFRALGLGFWVWVEFSVLFFFRVLGSGI